MNFYIYQIIPSDVTSGVEVVHMVVPLGYKMEIGSVFLYVVFVSVSMSRMPNPPNVWCSGGLFL